MVWLEDLKGKHVEVNGVPLPDRKTVKIGGNVTGADNAGEGSTDLTIGGASDFTDLGDAPADYTGQAGKHLAVNGGETGLEFVDANGGAGAGPSSALIGHTGIIKGGVLSINGGDASKFDIGAGRGWVIDHSDPENPAATEVEWTARTAQTVTALASAPITHVGIDVNGVVVQKAGNLFSPLETRQIIILGSLLHEDNAQISQAIYSPAAAAYDGTLTYMDFVREVIGPANIEGNNYAATGASLEVSKTSGRAYAVGVSAASQPQVPDISNDPALPTASFFRIYRSLTPGIMDTDGPLVTEIDPDSWDDGSGTLQTVGNNDWTVQVIYWSPDGGGNTVIAYGQTTYNTLLAAQNALWRGTLVYEERASLRALLVRSYLIVKKGATDLSDDSQAVFFEAPAFRIAGVATNAGAAAVEAFLDLSDTPGLYTGQAGKSVRVNSGENALEFVGNTLDWALVGIDTGSLTQNDLFPLNTTLLDSSGNAGTVSGNEWTCPKTGLWSVEVYVRYGSSAVSDPYTGRLALDIDSVEVQLWYDLRFSANVGGSNCVFNPSRNFKINAGQAISIRHDSSSTITIGSDGPLYISLTRIGD